METKERENNRAFEVASELDQLSWKAEICRLEICRTRLTNQSRPTSCSGTWPEESQRKHWLTVVVVARLDKLIPMKYRYRCLALRSNTTQLMLHEEAKFGLKAQHYGDVKRESHGNINTELPAFLPPIPCQPF